MSKLAPGQVSLQLRMTEEDREMIKTDAKALGMTPTKYVVMLSRMMNESSRELAMTDFADKMTKALLKGFEKGTSEK